MLGLMQCVRELYVGEATAVSYNFLHLTVQEYLAAFHITNSGQESVVCAITGLKWAIEIVPNDTRTFTVTNISTAHRE